MGDVNVLYKMKELWFYQIQQFKNAETYGKKIKKVQNRRDYEQVVKELFASGIWEDFL